MTKINITTLGCPKNTVDSGHLLKMFEAQGFVCVQDSVDADILLINTCGFIKDAKEESVEEILRLAQLKDSGKRLVVFGCLAKRYRDELTKDILEMDALFGVGEDDKIVEYCKSLKKQKKAVQQPNNDREAALPLNQTYAYLKIAEGCDKKCTFCVIPSIRGKFRSAKPADILKEAEEYIGQGVRELILVAQDISNYGKEWENYNLVSLLNDLCSIKGDFRIRLLYLYPTEITDELIKCIASQDKIQKYVDMPLQHSEDKILRLMGRRGTKKQYIKLIRTIRRIMPQIALRTTFIVGFPGETEDDFNGLVDFIEEMRFDRLGVFKYSKEEGSPAAKLKGHVPEKVKDRRLDEIMRRQALISLDKNMEMVGKIYEAIIDEAQDNIAIGRLYSHAPEIDGVVIVEDGSLNVGDVVNVEIVEAYDYDLKGKVVR
jgi:ribosomal protein S12 methylthiotransferase